MGEVWWEIGTKGWGMKKPPEGEADRRFSGWGERVVELPTR